MMRILVLVALVFAALLAAPQLASAQSQSCKDFRESIINMENESVRPPGWLMLDSHLRLLYEKYCQSDPVREREPEFWYRADGTPTGVSSKDERPIDGAYATTKAIGDFCLNQAGDMIVNAQGNRVRAGMDPSICALTGGDMEPAKPERGEPLPPLLVAGLDSNEYDLSECLVSLTRFTSDMLLNETPTASSIKLRSGYLGLWRRGCPGFIAAIEKQAGTRADDLSGPFWDGLNQLLMTPPMAANPAPTDALAVAVDPGWQEMCRQAEANAKQCKISHEVDIRTPGTTTLGTSGQAGAFYECRKLYDSVLGMCNGTAGAAMNAAAAKAQAMPQMSAQCQPLVSALVAAAKANDGPGSVAAHEAMKQAGGCGVLDKVATPAQRPTNTLPTRGNRQMLNTYVDGCDRNQAACNNAVALARQGASPEATAALWNHSIGIGLQVGAILGTGVLMYQYSQMPRASGGGRITTRVGAAPPPPGSLPQAQGRNLNQSGVSTSSGGMRGGTNSGSAR